MNRQVDEYVTKHAEWRDELQELRGIVFECELSEDYKWRAPCYTHDGANVVMLGAFKEYAAISFLKGSLLKDTKQILVAPGENSRAVRLVRFTSVAEIAKLARVLKSYIKEAIKIEQAGLKVSFDENKVFDLPEELLNKFREVPGLEQAFRTLTTGRQRAYVLHITGAKQSATRTARVEKHVPRIFAGKGLNDCICGHSKKPPGCDGSHQYIDRV
ncbi:MAG: YdeI/OmpD-associated family protein [Planctomycetales bacterium]|nr:YdeI/OmpD-associated family protein [Planctomycetales bacterium]